LLQIGCVAETDYPNIKEFLELFLFHAVQVHAYREESETDAFETLQNWLLNLQILHLPSIYRFPTDFNFGLVLLLSHFLWVELNWFC
jgi:hypothetical protein